MNSQTVSPQQVSKADGEKDSGLAGMGNDGKKDDAMNENDEVCMPLEDEIEVQVDDQATQEAVRIKVLPSPNPPSRQEALEHYCTHIPFRSWCPHCVRGKSKAAHHKASGGMSKSDTPVVSFDYAFIGDKQGREDKDDVQADAESDDEEALLKATVLVGRDAKSRVCCAIPVPQKGIDVMEWSLREGLRFLDFLGYTTVVVKSDQEAALGSLINRMKTHRGEHTQTMIEHSPVGDSKSNGFIERTIQSVEGQIRTLSSATQSRIGVKMVPGSALYAWMITHAANLINLYEIGQDGRVPYHRLRGRKLQTEMMEFG